MNDDAGEKGKGGRLTHVDGAGRLSMVDVSGKAPQARYALASGFVRMSEACRLQVAENGLSKGDVLASAELAGVMAAKRTSDLVPLCHPLRLDRVVVRCRLTDEGVAIAAEAWAYERTGVEMEALTAASAAALTVFDMCKAVDPSMQIGPIRVERKQKDGRTVFSRE